MSHGVCQVCALGAGRCGYAEKPRIRTGVIHIDAIEEQHMEMDIQIECPAEALDQGDGAGVRHLVSEPRLPDQVCGNHTVDNTQHPAHDRRTAGQQQPQRIWKAQHPLPHRLVPARYHRPATPRFQPYAVPHSSGRIRGVRLKRLLLVQLNATRLFGVAASAACSQQTVLQTAASEVVLELALDIHRQALPCAARWDTKAG